MIDVRNLVKDYGPTRAVAGVSFSVAPGEVVGLLGPNGAGKSTTLRVLTGYLPPTAGEVKLGGVDVLEDPLAARRKLGYLAESNPLYDALGVWECLDLFGRLRGVPDHLLPRRIADVVDRCTLSEVMHKDVGQLSKGFRQRLGLALAILHDPEVLILDEPTSALDPNQQKEVRDLILQLKEKKTVLLSTHILPEAENLCDRLLIIHQGRIAAQGTIEELRRRQAGQNSFQVTLRGRREDILKGLAKIRDLVVAEESGEVEPGAWGFLVSSPNDVREELAALAAAKHWSLLELKRQTASLDNIFQSLTLGERS